MADLRQYNTDTIEPIGDFEPIPEGMYKAMIVSSEMKSTKNGNGQYLSLELEVIEGQFKGRKIWDILNLINPNEKAVEIAYRTLESIKRATHIRANDSNELHNIPMLCKVGIEKSEGYEPKNKIMAYSPLTQQVPASPKNIPSQQSVPPWMK